MTPIAYAACFLALAGLAGVAATNRASWLARLPLLVVTPLLALAVWWQLSQESGWPAHGHPADGSVFVASVVQSPTPTNGGAIFVWTQPPGSATPRAFRLPYDPRLEQQVARAASASKGGARVAIRLNTDPAKRHAGRSGSPSQGQKSKFIFYKLPPSGIQSKTR